MKWQQFRTLFLGFLLLMVCSLIMGEPTAIGCSTALVLIFGILFWALKSQQSSQPNSKSQRPARQRNLQFTISTSYQGYGDSFVKQAKKFAKRQGTVCAHVPFKAYRSTYSDMNKGQLKWYFYWRDQARSGHFLPTSLSYIYVHVYELINQVGVSSSEEGYQQLVKLWLHYRKEHEQLDNYLADWLADYVALYLPESKPLDVYQLPSPTRYYTTRFVDYLLPPYLNGRLHQIPLAIIDGLVDYRIDRSRFYDQYPDLLEKTLQSVLVTLDDYARSKKQTGIFEKYRPDLPVQIERYPFQGAHYAGSAKQMQIATLYDYSRSEGLRRFLTGVVKYTENLLRQQKGVRGRLKVEGVGKTAKKLIESVVAGRERPEAVELVLEAVSRSGGVAIPTAKSDIEHFVSQGEALAQQTAAQSPYVPFMASYPTYEMLSPAQQAYYLFWRGEVRNGRYLQTDHGYLTLYLLELLHTIGADAPQAAFGQLKALWTAYAQQYKNLNQPILTWSMAYSQLHSLSETPSNILLWPGAVDVVQPLAPDVVLHHYLSSDLAQTSLPLWEHYVDYDIRQTRFFADAVHKKQLEQALPFVLNAVNKHFQKKDQTSLFEKYRPTQTHGLPVAYCVLPPADWPHVIYAFDAPLYAQAISLRQILTAVTKQTENYLRQVNNVRGRLKVSGLDTELCQLIDRATAEANNPNRHKQITIDYGRVDTLQQENEAIIELLTLEEAQSASLVQDVEPELASASASSSDLLLMPTAAPDAFADEEEIWLAFADQLSKLQVELLHLVLSEEDATTTVHALAMQNHTMPALLIDSINEMAQDAVQDVLLDVGPPLNFVDTYYSEMIEQTLPQRNPK